MLIPIDKSQGSFGARKEVLYVLDDNTADEISNWQFKISRLVSTFSSSQPMILMIVTEYSPGTAWQCNFPCCLESLNKSTTPKICWLDVVEALQRDIFPFAVGTRFSMFKIYLCFANRSKKQHSVKLTNCTSMINSCLRVKHVTKGVNAPSHQRCRGCQRRANSSVNRTVLEATGNTGQLAFPRFNDSLPFTSVALVGHWFHSAPAEPFGILSYQ